MTFNQKPLSRRSVTTGLAAAVAAIPAVGLASAARRDPVERIKNLTRELEQAMRDCYGVAVTVLSYEATASMRPMVLVVANTPEPEGCLCVGCLERRIGRQLKPKDFLHGDTWNDPRLPASPRLRKRRKD